jgi:hypothetical protein
MSSPEAVNAACNKQDAYPHADSRRWKERNSDREIDDPQRNKADTPYLAARHIVASIIAKPIMVFSLDARVLLRGVPVNVR